MTTGYEDHSQFLEGTETVSLYVTDNSSAVSVANALTGELSFREASQLGTLNLETEGMAIELDAADLNGAIPKRGSKIVRADTTPWRVQSISSDHVIGVYRCLCVKTK
jgi:hypothetical protein